MPTDCSACRYSRHSARVRPAAGPAMGGGQHAVHALIVGDVPDAGGAAHGEQVGAIGADAGRVDLAKGAIEHVEEIALGIPQQSGVRFVGGHQPGAVGAEAGGVDDAVVAAQHFEQAALGVPQPDLPV